MLSRLATRVTRSWTHPDCRRVHILNVTKPVLARNFVSDPLSSGECRTLLESFVERKLKTVRTSLCVDIPLKPASSVEFDKWKDAVDVANIDAAVETCGERLPAAPNWVLLYLLDSKVYTPSQAMTAVNIMLQHFPRTDKILQPAFIILAIRFLARQQVEVPVPNLIKLFLVLEIPGPPTQFNLLLRNMSHFKPSPTLAKVTTQVLDAMHGRQIKLHSRTYRTLLSNSLVSLELAKRLQQTMELEGVKPNRYHLEAYLRVFAHHGAVHASARYLNLMKERSERTGAVAPHGVELSSHGSRAVKSGDSVNGRWNTEFLTSFKRNTGSAFQYLRDMVDEKDIPPVLPRIARKESRIVTTIRKSRPLVWKHKVHVSDWVTVLNVAARDTSLSSTRLLQLFDETRAAVGYPPNVATFTVLIRGLVRKGDHATAMDVWERCCASWSRRRKIDTKALTVAMEVIVGTGYPLAAFDTLVETTGILHDKENPAKLDRTAIGRRYKRALYSKYAKVDVPLVNALMNAYQKNGRSDLVFKLWDVFVPLFGVHPNAKSLTIVLDAAYSVSRWDHTFRGLLEQLGLHDFFKSTSRSSGPTEEKNRRQIVQHVRGVIKRDVSASASGKVASGSKEVVHEAKAYLRKTLWDGELAAPKALRLFREIVLGNYPELETIVPPATAVWPDEAKSTNPMRDALSSLGLRLRSTDSRRDVAPHMVPDPKLLLVGPSLAVKREHALPPLDIITSSAYPQIVPDGKSFEAYIYLLGAMHRASEIATVLAWMRALDVRPLRRSLAIALALWSEASVRGPLIEKYGAPSEFDKLHRWLLEWLGYEGLPTEAAMSWAFGKLKEEREK